MIQLDIIVHYILLNFQLWKFNVAEPKTKYSIQLLFNFYSFWSLQMLYNPI